MLDNLENDFESEELVEVKDNTDFPFREVSVKKWIISWTILILSFVLVDSASRYIHPFAGIILFVVGSIVSLLVLDLKFFPRIFKIPRFRDIFTILITIIITFIVVIIVSSLLGGQKMEANPVFDVINNENIKKLTIILAVQLIFEEIQFVVPFLFIYNMLVKKNKTLALIVAWLISSEVFGLLHLTTYNYNFLQCMVLIPTVRLGITYAYVKTKNLLVSYGAHLAWDMILIFLTLFAINNGLV